MIEKIYIDVIIISYAQTDVLKSITENCIQSLLQSEDQDRITFNIVVLESEKSIMPFEYQATRTIYPDVPFNYHQYMQLGIQLTSSPYVCLCNNDLIFHNGWASEILKPIQQYVDVYSASPYCTTHHTKAGIKPNNGSSLGYRIRTEIAGWCIFVKREIFNVMGQLDPNYVFWYADNDYANTLYVLKIKHVLVTSSFVDHLESKTLKKQTAEREIELTDGEITYYEKKWDYRLGKRWQVIS